MIDVSLARRCEAHGYDYFRSDDPVAAAGFVVSVELWAWTWERHGFRAFAETAAPQLIWREYRPGWTRYGDGSVAQVKSIFDAPRGYLNAACRRRVVHWASGLLRRIL